VVPITARAAPMPTSGTLTIHKYAMEDTSVANPPNDGASVAVPADAVPLVGVEFSVWQVDPSVAAGITMAAQAWPHIMTATQQTGATDANGEAVFTLPRGIYYVAETGTTGDTAPCDPFLVTVPYEDSTGTWQTDVHAYPKSQTLVINQFVGPAGDADYDFINYNVSKEKPVAIGEPFGVTTLASIPVTIGTTSDESYYLTVTLDKHYEYPGGTLKVYTVPAMTTPIASAALLSDIYYSLTYDPVTGVPTSLVMNSAGISQLSSRVQAGDRYVMVKFDCQLIKTAPAGVNLYGGATLEYTKSVQPVSARSGVSGMTLLSASGTTAAAVPMASTGTAATATVQDAPAVHTGKIGITKVAVGTDKPLSGADFGIAKTKADAQTGNFIATGTTDTNGILTFNGLEYGLPGDQPNENSNNTTFWLVETKAPDGYKLMSSPVEITFSFQQDGNSSENYFAWVMVYNVAKAASGSTGTSPKTGDESNIAFYLALCVVSLAAVTTLALCMRKKRRNQEQ